MAFYVVMAHHVWANISGELKDPYRIKSYIASKRRNSGK